MSRDTLEDLAQRKALLTARAELERMQIALAVHDLRMRIAPPAAPRPRGARPGVVAAAVVGLGVPLLGRARLARALRGVSLLVTLLRIVRQWKAPGR